MTIVYIVLKVSEHFFQGFALQFVGALTAIHNSYFLSAEEYCQNCVVLLAIWVTSSILLLIKICILFDRCCNTCDDVREAYRRRGWAFKNPDTIEQCKREGFSQKMQEQKNEGCKVYGFLEVNKVSDILFIIA